MLDRTTSALCRISALASCNRLDDARSALVKALETGVDPAALYETLFQIYLFAGFPPALEGLRMLHAVIGELGMQWHPPALAPYDVEAFRTRGEALYRNVYSTNYERLRTAVETFSPDMFESMIVEGYGKVLSRPGLSGSQRELITVTSLTALGWERQTISHARGAVNLGAEPADVFEAIALAEVCATAERVQKMMGAVAPHL